MIRIGSFQFHSGSIQTRARETNPGSASPVSIPLWFDSNLKVAFILRATAGFNSTLVRFKRVVLLRSW